MFFAAIFSCVLARPSVAPPTVMPGMATACTKMRVPSDLGKNAAHDFSFCVNAAKIALARASDGVEPASYLRYETDAIGTK